MKGGAVEDDNVKAINMYADPRAGTEDMPDTIITCLHFLDAVQDDKYGWRWECPNKGTKCQYRHMLPEGYVLTSKKEREAARKQAEEDKKNARTIEEDIEEERAKLKSDDCTPVTKESFFAWKERRAAQKQKAAEEALLASQQSAAKKREMTKGKNSVMSGRALFSFKPELFTDAEGAGGAETFEEEKVDAMFA